MLGSMGSLSRTAYFGGSLLRSSRFVNENGSSAVSTTRFKRFLTRSEKNYYHKPRYKGKNKTREVLFGIHPVREALTQRRRQLFRLHLKRDFEANPKLRQLAASAETMNIPVEFRETGELDRLVELDNFNNFRPHQGVCLDCSPLPTIAVSTYSDFLSSVSLTSQWLFPILVDVKDPMNFGAILRSASFFGLDSLLLLGVGGMRKVTPVVSKASSGAAEVTELFRLEDGLDFLTEAREMGDNILGTSMPEEVDENDDVETSVGFASLFDAPSASQLAVAPPTPTPPPPPGVRLYDAINGALLPHDVLPRRSPTFLLFGSEGRGLDPALLRLCHFHVRINHNDASMTGRRRDNDSSVNSLNVSVASGILLHHFVCS